MRKSMAWVRGLGPSPGLGTSRGLDLSRWVPGRDATGGSGELLRRRADVVVGLPDDDRVIAACNGSANPALLDWVVDRLGASANERVVDVGAGLGGPGRWVQRRTGAQVVGLDVIPEAAEGLHRLFPRLVAVVGDARCLPLPTARVDHVLAVGLLDDCGDPDRVVAEVARVLRPGGRLVATVRTCSVALDPATGPGHRRVTDYLEALHGAGFVEISLEDLTKLPPVPDHWVRVGMAVQAAMADWYSHPAPEEPDPQPSAASEATDGAGLRRCGIVATRRTTRGHDCTACRS